MSGAPRLLLSDGEPAVLAAEVLGLWRSGEVLALAAPQEAELLQRALAPLPLDGPAVVLGTGGSSGGRRWCVQPLVNLQASAQGCGQWLLAIGLDPARCQLFNPLPLHHVSGLMPLLRSAGWGAEHRALATELLRQPALLRREATPAADRPALLSLVPTQLQRLLDDPDGRCWLDAFALIWVGGAAMPAPLAERCRQLGLRLAPCYGSTETGSMVAALPPEAFLAGVPGCGPALPHARLRLGAGGALAIQATSLAAGFLSGGCFEPLPLDDGWWCSGDGVLLTSQGLQWQCRLDGAISSGGETVFPEQVRQRLLELLADAALSVQELLLLPEHDALWGQRLAALVRLPSDAQPGVLLKLEAVARALPPSQRPRRWLRCPELAATAAGKWDQQHWRSWLADQRAERD